MIKRINFKAILVIFNYLFQSMPNIENTLENKCILKVLGGLDLLLYETFSTFFQEVCQDASRNHFCPTFCHFKCPKGDTWDPKWLQSGSKSSQHESKIDLFSMSGARGYPQVPKGYPLATPNLQNIDQNHKIHSKYTSQNTTNNVRHISKKKIQNGTAGYF